MRIMSGGIQEKFISPRRNEIWIAMMKISVARSSVGSVTAGKPVNNLALDSITSPDNSRALDTMISSDNCCMSEHGSGQDKTVEDEDTESVAVVSVKCHQDTSAVPVLRQG